MVNRPKIVVTGGLGYIGSHTCVALHEQGYEPIIIDNLDNSRIEVLDGLESITGVRFKHHINDICEKGIISRLMEQYDQVKGIIHFAAYKAVGESVEQPLKYYHNNIQGLVQVLEAVKRHNIQNVVFSSSCTVYGDQMVSPVSENQPIQEAASPYGFTKIIGEHMLADFSRAHSKSTISLRYFNPVGAHPSAKIGELPLGVPNNLVPYITQTAAGLRKELTVFGNDYATPDGTCIRDYIHVMDLAEAHVKALEIEPIKPMEYFNVGTGNGKSVLEVIECFEAVNGIKLNYKMGNRRAGDVEQIWADPTKAEKHLNWEAKYSLADMMQHAWKWQRTLPKKKE